VGILISALIPTVAGREHWLEKCIASIEACGGDVEVVVERNGSNWGEAINFAAERATGTHFFLGSDDHEVLPGWWEAAAGVCDRGLLPAPKMFNTDGSLQSCGEWEREQPDGDTTEFSRVPFVSRAQWELFGPLLPIHFSDVYLCTNAREVHGVETVVCHGYRLIHHFAQESRRRYQPEEKLRLRTEAAARTGGRVGAS
jgi:hypothetical protein